MHYLILEPNDPLQTSDLKICMIIYYNTTFVAIFYRSQRKTKIYQTCWKQMCNCLPIMVANIKSIDNSGKLNSLYNKRLDYDYLH